MKVPPAKFSLKDAVMLCLLLLGIKSAASILMLIFRVDFTLLYDAAFLVIVILLARSLDKNEVSRILSYKPVSVYLFFSLVVMFMGLEILRTEALNLWIMLIPIPEDYFGSGTRGIFLAILSYAVFPAFTEELFFRGVLLTRLRRNYPERKAILLSALLFGLMHLNPWQFLGASLSGLFYGWIYLRFKNIWLCMFMHFYNNILATFLTFPEVILPNRNSYDIWVVHPLWFDILGLCLFLAGFGITIALTRLEKADVRGPDA
jgi:membrane protease YdiL (CAAX protease family)